MHRMNVLSLVATLSLAICTASSGLAQTTWMHPPMEKGIALELTKPQFDYGENFKFWTNTIFLYGKLRLGPNLALVIEIPIANLDYKVRYVYPFGQEYTTRETGFGNPYLGVNFGREGSSVIGALGVRPPLASEDDRSPLVVSAYTMYDRFEAFVPKLFTLSGALGYRYLIPSEQVKPTFKFLIGPTLMAPDEGDSELFFDAATDFWVEARLFAAGFGVSGRAVLTEEDLDFGERTVFQGKLAAQFIFGQVRPGLHIQVPLDEPLTEIVDVVYGIDLAVTLK